MLSRRSWPGMALFGSCRYDDVWCYPIGPGEKVKLDAYSRAAEVVALLSIEELYS